MNKTKSVIIFGIAFFVGIAAMSRIVSAGICDWGPKPCIQDTCAGTLSTEVRLKSGKPNEFATPDAGDQKVGNGYNGEKFDYSSQTGVCDLLVGDTCQDLEDCDDDPET